MLFAKAALAVAALSTFATGKQHECEVEFILYNADKDKPLRTLKDVECISSYNFNIQAIPSCPDKAKSAKLYLDGPIDVQGRMERKVPYMVFGDDALGDIFGMKYMAGNYKIKADIYSGKRLKGEIIASGEFDFKIKKC